MVQSLGNEMHVYSNTGLIYKKKRLQVEKLLEQDGPEIELTYEQLHPDYEMLVTGYHIKFKRYTGIPLVTKHEGSYVVLLGHTAFKNAQISKLPVKCKLLSNVALKNTFVKNFR